MAEDFEAFVRKQFPLRPEGHPDWERLTKVVAQVETWIAQGVAPKQAYGTLFDTYSVGYLAANRVGMTPPPSYEPLDVQVHQTNLWVEGFLFGALFQKLGGGVIQDQEPDVG